MTLSADNLNHRSPYQLAKVNDMILAYYQDFLKHVPELFTPRDK